MEDYVPKEGNGIIYRYIFDNGKIYVGQTKYSLLTRHRQHCRGGDQLISKAISKHTYKLEVIEEVTVNELDDEEIKHISENHSLYPDGYNLTTGGRVKHTLHPIIRDKISKSNYGKPKSEKARENMSKARIGVEPWNKGKPCSEATKRKISETLKSKEIPSECLEALHRYYETHDVWNKGGTLPDELKKRISDKLKGRKLPPEQVKKTADALRGKKRPRECIEKGLKTRIERGQTVKVRNMDTGQEFNSIEEAQRMTGANNIRLVLKGKIKKSGGYRWERII